MCVCGVVCVCLGRDCESKRERAAVARCVVSLVSLFLQWLLALHVRTTRAHTRLVLLKHTHVYIHRGVNNNFLRNTFHPVAIMYNDTSPLENMHAAEALRLSLSLGDRNPFNVLSDTDFVRLRATVIQLVLHTVRLLCLPPPQTSPVALDWV